MSLRDTARGWLRRQLAPDEPAPRTRRRRRGDDEEELTARARERQQEAREAADLRKIATDPDVRALALETAQKHVERIAYCGIVGGLAFTMVNVQAFAAHGEVQFSILWWAAWLLDPVVSAVLIATLVANRTLARYGVSMGRLPGVVALVCVAATYVMNTWKSWAEWSASGIVLHSIPPLIVYLTIEALPAIREQFAVAIAKAHEDAQAKPDEPPVPEVPPAGLPEVNAARQAAGVPPITAQVPDPAGTRPDPAQVPDPTVGEVPDPGTPEVPDPTARPEGGEVPDPDAVPWGMPAGNPADDRAAWIEWLAQINVEREAAGRPMIGATIFNRWCRDAGRSVNKDRNAEIVREAKAAATIHERMTPDPQSSVVQLRRSAAD